MREFHANISTLQECVCVVPARECPMQPLNTPPQNIDARCDVSRESIRAFPFVSPDNSSKSIVRLFPFKCINSHVPPIIINRTCFALDLHPLHEHQVRVICIIVLAAHASELYHQAI